MGRWYGNRDVAWPELALYSLVSGFCDDGNEF